jgi:uncharacterized protein YciI
MLGRAIQIVAVALLTAFILHVETAFAEDAAAPKQYLYTLRLVPRLHDPKAWTEKDNHSVAAHFQRLQEATAQRKVIIAGRTDEPLESTCGIVVFEASSPAEARAFMESDPTVLDEVMVAELHPFSVALLRRELPPGDSLNRTH